MISPAGVICLGEALIDLSAPPGETLATSERLHATPGGAPLNIAVHLKRTGHNPVFAGTLSNDAFGDRIRELLASEGIPYSPSEPVEALTRLAVIDQREGNPPFRFYGDRPADSYLSIDNLDAIFESDAKAIYAGSLMMIDLNTRSTQTEALRRASARNMLVACDPNPRPAAWRSLDDMLSAVEAMLTYATLVKFSIDDARALGWPDGPEGLLQFVRTRSSATLVVTDGPRGCWISTSAGEMAHYVVPEVPVVDATGAGDAFFATIIAGMLEDGFISGETAQRACATGANVASRQGAL